MEKVKFCQQASESYEKLLDESGGDPRIAAGKQALKDSKDGAWVPTVDARDARLVLPGMKKVKKKGR